VVYPKYKSQLEVLAAALLKRAKVKIEYEPDILKFVQPAKERKYTPDFRLGSRTYIEVKGKLDAASRHKYVWVSEQNPDVRLYFLFGKADNRITKNSRTTYADWAEKNGFEWADIRVGIPKHWLKS
jgi:hypothetical protein